MNGYDEGPTREVDYGPGYMPEFLRKMQDEGYVQQAEGVLADIREHLLERINTSLSDSRFKDASTDAGLLGSLMEVEEFLLSITPTFGRGNG